MSLSTKLRGTSTPSGVTPTLSATGTNQVFRFSPHTLSTILGWINMVVGRIAVMEITTGGLDSPQAVMILAKRVNFKVQSIPNSQNLHPLIRIKPNGVCLGHREPTVGRGTW